MQEALLLTPIRTARPLVDHYRCSPDVLDFGVPRETSGSPGFFRFGPQAVCYGRVDGHAGRDANGHLFDAAQRVHSSDGVVQVPFDVGTVVDNLRYERYAASARRRLLQGSWATSIYYSLRPLLPVSLRKHLQRAYFRGWESRKFPAWPVERSVDILLERLLVAAMKAGGTERLPFVWFWPEGYKACAILTHDVEEQAGYDFTEQLLDIDDAFGIKSSIQVVPEKRYSVSLPYLEMIRSRGFELNIHGLDHDGNLFENRERFLSSARKINDYAREYGARGFRSPSMYRNADWFKDLDFSYDMSVPTVASLEPQQGGCCTVMPYFLPGGMTELPLTTIQDYSIFHMMNDYSMSIWKQQIEAILKANGLISCIVHPDYVISNRAQDVYKSLLEEISRLRSGGSVWVTLPGNVDSWWRERNEMTVVPAGKEWTIEGPGSHRARLAYACLDGDRLVYEIS